MQLYMLDTDISSYIIKERPPQVKARLDRFAMEQLCVSVVTKAELLYGVKRSSSPKVNQPIVEAFLKHVTVLDWDGLRSYRSPGVDGAPQILNTSLAACQALGPRQALQHLTQSTPSCGLPSR